MTARLKNSRRSAATDSLERALDLRLHELKVMAQAEDEPFNQDSEKDLQAFFSTSNIVRKPAIFLMENGNLRTVWRDEGGDHLGVQFLGGQEVEYVIFAQRAETGRVARVAGRDSLAGVTRQIEALDVGHLLTA